MMEMKITVEAPDLAASILKLAEAIASGPDPALLIPDEPLPVSAYLPEHEQHQQRHLPEHQWQCQQQQLHQHQRVPPRSDGKARPSRPKAKSSAIHHIKGGHIQP